MRPSPDGSSNDAESIARYLARSSLDQEANVLGRLLPASPGFIAVAKPLMFHWTVLLCDLEDPNGCVDRWCYRTQEMAHQAVLAWEGQGDPPGPWHRHPLSGRRRPNGDASKEYLNP